MKRTIGKERLVDKRRRGRKQGMKRKKRDEKGATKTGSNENLNWMRVEDLWKS